MSALLLERAEARTVPPNATLRRAGAANDLERREPAAGLGALLDELDYGVFVLDDGARVLCHNRAASAELRTGRSVEVEDGRLRACRTADAAALCDAMQAAAWRGLRRLVTIGDGDDAVTVALIPIGGTGYGRAATTMAVFGRRRLCERISVQWYAQAHGLTPAESRVLEALCDGLDPRAIAAACGVRMTTVRTHVSRIREKTGAACIRVAMLPPVVSALRA